MRGLLLTKLWRDLGAGWPRFLMMVLAIAVSLTAFGAVVFAWSASGRETSNSYLSTKPASATILLDQAITTQQMAEITAQTTELPGIIEATGRTQLDTDVKVNGVERTLPLQVFAAPPSDPMRMATFFMNRNGWPPAAGEIFISGDSLDLLDVAVGDKVTIDTPRGRPASLQVTDTVYDPSLSPSPQEQRGRGYVSTSALTASPDEAILDQVKIQVADPGGSTATRDRDRVVASATEVGQWLQREHGLAIREIQVPTPYEHPHQWQADALLGSLLAGGAAALLLSTMLVGTMLNNLFAQQIPQIGIMKAIGARSSSVGRFYLGMILVVAAAATLLALAPAVLLGRLAVSNFLGFLGIEPTSLAAPGWTYLVILALGLGLPPLMALIPLLKTSRITVRAAIDHHGGTARAGRGVLVRLGGLRRLNRGLLMVLRNTLRRPARSLLAVGLLASAGMVFVAGMSLSSGVEAIEEEQKAQRNWDVDVQLVTPATMDQVIAALRQVENVTRVEGLRVVPVGVAGPGQLPITRTYPDQGHGRISMTAVARDPDLFTPPSKLLEGRWLEPGETGAVVLNQVTRENTVPGIGAADTVELIVDGKATSWRVVGVVEETGGKGGVYVSAEGFAMGQRPEVNQLRIATTTHDETTRQTVAESVEAELATAGIEVRSAVSVSRSEDISGGHLGPIILILLGIALPLGVVGVIGLASTMSANILDRTREFGVMHAIGALPKTVRRLVVGEGIFLALVSCLVAVVPALVLTAILGEGLGNLFFSAPLPYRVSIPATVIWMVIVILGAAIATEAAATQASRMTVREALAYL